MKRPSPAQKMLRKIRREWAKPSIRRRFFIGICLVLLLGVLYSFYRSNMTVHIKEYSISSPYLPNAFSGYKIAQISDLHGNLNEKKGKKLKEMIDEASPNILVITGDLISRNEKNPDAVLTALAPIAKEIPTYYVRGNHELYRDANGMDAEEWNQKLTKAGFVVMDNRSIPLIYQGEQIVLCGFTDSLESYQSKDSELTESQIEAAISKKTDAYTVLLTHNPRRFSSYVQWGADLTFAGHLHGGGIRLPLVGGLVGPNFELFPHYDYGVYGKGRQHMVVSSGMGNSGLPFRLFNDEELVMVTLLSQSIH